MTQTALPNVGINAFWDEGQDGWKDGVDLNWLLLNAMSVGVAVDQVNADPWASVSSPTPGLMYLVGTAPTGATAPWNTASAATIANKLAIATGNNAEVTRWHMVTPKEGWRVFNAATKQWMQFFGTHGSGGYWMQGTGISNSEGAEVIDMITSAEPASPSVGDAYIIAPTGSGTNWSNTHDNYYARCRSASPVAWDYVAPIEGMRVRDAHKDEWARYNGSSWEYESKYLVANSRSFTLIDCGNPSGDSYSASRAAPSLDLSREQCAAQAIAFLSCGMVGAVTFTNATGGAIAGNGTLDSVDVSNHNAPNETWTLICTAGGPTATFSVTGSVSGAQANATVGTPYDNGLVKFTLTDGAVDFSSAAPADKIEFEIAEFPITFPTEHGDVIPALTGVFNLYSSGTNGNRFKMIAGTGEVTLYKRDGFSLVQAIPSINLCTDLLEQGYSHRKAFPISHGGIEEIAASFTLRQDHPGMTIVVDGTASSRTVTIPAAIAADLGRNAMVRLFIKGANAPTFSAGAGVTLIGKTTASQNDVVVLMRDGVTDTWYCG